MVLDHSRLDLENKFLENKSSHIWGETVLFMKVKESKEWSSQWIYQFKQSERRSLKKKKKKNQGSTIYLTDLG